MRLQSANLPGREAKRKQYRCIASIGDKASGKLAGLPFGRLGLLLHYGVISHLRYPYRGLGNALYWSKTPRPRKN